MSTVRKHSSLPIRSPRAVCVQAQPGAQPGLTARINPPSHQVIGYQTVWCPDARELVVLLSQVQSVDQHGLGPTDRAPTVTEQQPDHSNISHNPPTHHDEISKLTGCHCTMLWYATASRPSVPASLPKERCTHATQPNHIRGLIALYLSPKVHLPEHTMVLTQA